MDHHKNPPFARQLIHMNHLKHHLPRISQYLHLKYHNHLSNSLPINLLFRMKYQSSIIPINIPPPHLKSHKHSSSSLHLQIFAHLLLKAMMSKVQMHTLILPIYATVNAQAPLHPKNHILLDPHHQSNPPQPHLHHRHTDPNAHNPLPHPKHLMPPLQHHPTIQPQTLTLHTLQRPPNPHGPSSRTSFPYSPHSPSPPSCCT